MRANAARLAEFVDSASVGQRCEGFLSGVARALVMRRTAFAERVALPVSGVGEAVERLGVVAGGSLPRGAVWGGADRERLVLVFPGQGGQFPGMCRSLLGDEVFRAALVECDAVLRPHTGFSVVELLEAADEVQREWFEWVSVVQPVLFAVGVALSRVWRHWGVVPSAVVGHSQGEVAAAVA
ncbi:acyltransferase domain-containing protein, partial [Actinopolyspora sp. H202]|uniref:acyltransferase domain-containing protein n=1 Tax=Actinopolyspora sp. H202 TaxID=1500456 RepID=UPI003EE53712